MYWSPRLRPYPPTDDGKEDEPLFKSVYCHFREWMEGQKDVDGITMESVCLSTESKSVHVRGPHSIGMKNPIIETRTFIDFMWNLSNEKTKKCLWFHLLENLNFFTLLNPPPE